MYSYYVRRAGQTVALTRSIPHSIHRTDHARLCEEPFNLRVALWQHGAYERALERAGCVIHRVPPEHDSPASAFIESLTVVLDEVAIITRPGPESRCAEIVGVVSALTSLRPLLFIESPAMLDGADVLRIGSTLYVGASRSTNSAGIRQLAQLVEPYGYKVSPIPISEGMHLRSAVSQVAKDTLLVNRAWLHGNHFHDLHVIEVHPGEPGGADALRINDAVIYDTAHPRTRDRLERVGIPVRPICLSELAKAGGRSAACSVIVWIQGPS